MTVQPIKNLGELRLMEEFLKNHGSKRRNRRNWLLFKVGINLALRISDLLRLKVKDVLSDYLHLVQGKNNKTIHIRLNGNTKRAIQDYLCKTRLRSDDYLFATYPEGLPPTRQQVWSILSIAARAVGIQERVGTHTLRKTWAHHAWVTYEADPLLIMKKLGHTDLKVTMRYIGIDTEQVNRIEQLVEL